MFWIYFAVFLPAASYGIGQPHYECGEHGRFEYCIDGIPGCVVGCHCHPGYYFDVESKICEPNAKLVQDYRRLYGETGPTRIPELFGGNNLQELSPTPTPSTLDSHVDNIAKDSNDLGDWLYNQFFKTIESQVINNTDNKDIVSKPTRRSGNDKYTGKRYRSKAKDKKKALRRKLLRISEDDSLFDDSDSKSDDDTDDSGSDSGSDSYDSGSCDDDDKPGKPGSKPSSSEHKDHKSFLWINKKPKAALPSFIFLPQIATPFFPPLGLPAPPMPMFPMIPGPPPMFPPAPSNQTAESNKIPETNKTAETSSLRSGNGGGGGNTGGSGNGGGSGGTGGETNSRNNVARRVVRTDDENKSLQSSKKEVKKSPLKSHHIKTSDIPKHDNKTDNLLDDDPPGDDDDATQDHTRLRASELRKRKRILKQLEERMKIPKIFPKKKKQRVEYPDILTDEEIMDSPMLDDAFAMGAEPAKHLAEYPEPPPENVDFKYLAQLIHRMDNKTKQNKVNAPTRKFSPSMNHFYPMATDDLSRRHFTNRRVLESSNDPYYSNLGHQIASLIRNIDATAPVVSPARAQQHFNVDARQPVFNENSYMPRSYWERSVRSLLRQYRPDNEQMSFRKYPDDNLFNLERKVENFASTAKTLSLNELENVVFVLDKTISQNSTENPNPKSSASNYANLNNNDRSLNINLLPRQYGNPKPDNYFNLGQPMSTLLDNEDNVNNIQTNLQGVLKNNFKNIPNYYSKNLFMNGSRFRDNSYLINNNLTEISRKEIANLQRMVGDKLKEVANSRSQLPKIPWLGTPNIANMLGARDVHLIANKVIRNPMKIKFQFDNNAWRHNYPSYKHNIDYNNRYLYRNGLLPLKLQVKSSTSLLKPQPSYFHHELQHLDFF